MSRGGKPGWPWGSGPSDAWECTLSGSVTLRSPEPGTWGGGEQPVVELVFQGNLTDIKV